MAIDIKELLAGDETLLTHVEVGTAASHQGRGIGKAMMKAMLEIGQELGCAVAWVITDRSNVVAQRLYQSTGGERTEEDIVMFNFDLTQAG